MEYYLKSAEKGNSDALNTIRDLYKKGFGVEIIKTAALNRSEIAQKILKTN